MCEKCDEFERQRAAILKDVHVLTAEELKATIPLILPLDMCFTITQVLDEAMAIIVGETEDLVVGKLVKGDAPNVERIMYLRYKSRDVAETTAVMRNFIRKGLPTSLESRISEAAQKIEAVSQKLYDTQTAH